MKNNKNIAIIVQARLGSKRLPNKSLLDLNGYPLIEWVTKRLSNSKLINNVIFAIPDTKQDDILSEYLKKLRKNIFRGSEMNVLKRVFDASLINNCDYVIRVCADNPFICSQTIDDLINFYFMNSYDYAYNHIPINNNFPDGIGAEIVSFKILKYINNHAKSESEREHIFNYIWNNPDKFNIGTYDTKNKEISYPHLKLDINTYDDLKFFNGVKLDINMGTNKIIKLILEQKQ